MQRRDFIQGSVLLMAAQLVTTALPSASKANIEAPAPTEDLLTGVIPTAASPATSSLFKYAHHHYLYVPKSILDNPPQNGFATYTSRIIVNLGMDPEEIKIKKERHFHEVSFNKRQLEMIRDSQMVVVDITSGPTVVHQFLFNGPKSFSEQILDLQKLAKAQGLLTKLP